MLPPWPGTYDLLADLPLTHRALRARAAASAPSARSGRAARPSSTCTAAARRASARTSPTTPEDQQRQQERRAGARRSRATGRWTRSPRTSAASTCSAASRRPCPPTATTAAGRSSPPRSTSRCARPATSLHERARARAAAAALRRLAAARRPAVGRRRRRPPRPPTATSRFKLDYEPEWNEELIADLAATGAVDVDRLQGRLQGHAGRRRHRPGALPPLRRGVPGRLARGPRPHRRRAADAALAPAPRPRHVGRADPLGRRRRCASAFAPKGLNCKPSRFGPLQRLFDFYDHCERERASRSTAAASPSSARAAGRSSCWPRSSTPTAPTTSRRRAGTRTTSRAPASPASPLDPAPGRRPGSGARTDVDSAPCRPKQRQIRMESKSAMAAMQRLETKSDEELLAETRYRSAAQAILGARAAERYDAKARARALPRPRSPPRARRSGCSCGGWPRRRWRWPSAGRTTCARPPIKLGQTPPSQPPAAGAALHGPGRAGRQRAAVAARRAASCCCW